VNFYKSHGARDELFNLVAAYRDEGRKLSDEYYKALSYYSLANYPLNNFTFRKVLHYEGVRGNELLALLRSCLAEGKSFSALGAQEIKDALAKAQKVRDILDSNETIKRKVEALAKHIQIDDLKSLERDLEQHGLDKKRIEAIEHQDEEEAELEEIQVKQMSAVATGPHTFLDHLPDAHLEFSRYTKTGRTQQPCGGRNGFLRYLEKLAAQSGRH
jgi:hypothetical protein